MDGVTVEDEVMIGAGSLVTPGKTLKRLALCRVTCKARARNHRARALVSQLFRAELRKVENRFLNESPTK